MHQEPSESSEKRAGYGGFYQSILQKKRDAAAKIFEPEKQFDLDAEL